MRALIGLSILGFLFGSTAFLYSKAGDRPNILWIIAEDMSQDLGCYGNEFVHTPNIDRLAARGMRFKNVFTTGPACSPSRTALATGVYQTTLGAYHMRYSEELMPRLPERIRTLPEMLRENGYFTGNIFNVSGTGTGKDDWLFKTSRKIWDTQSWEELVENEPFYGLVNMSHSHRPFARDSEMKVEEEGVEIPPYYPNHPVSRKDWAGYLEDVNRADELVGAILEKLESDGLEDNTIVVFLSDHGRPMIRAKNWLYDSGTQVPLVIYYPDNVEKPSRFKAGTENRDLISGVDLVAETILAAGGRIPEWMQGRSFLREKSEPRKAVFTAVDRIGNINTRSRSVRTHHFKYIRNYKIPGSINESTTAYRRAMHPMYHLLQIMGEKSLLTPAQARLLEPMAPEELYDLESDPFEMMNLVGNPEYVVQHHSLKAMLATWIETSGDRGFEAEDPAVAAYFNSYGQTTTKDLEKYGATTTDRLQKDFNHMRAYVQSHFE